MAPKRSLNAPNTEAKKRLSLVGSESKEEKMVSKRLSLGGEEKPPKKKLSRPQAPKRIDAYVC